LTSPFAQYADADCFGGKTREEFLEALRQALTGRVSGAWVFGSVARGNEERTSDVDLVLVAATNRKFHERVTDYSDLFDLCPRLDLLVYTPEEFRGQIQGQTGFWADFGRQALRIV